MLFGAVDNGYYFFSDYEDVSSYSISKITMLNY